MNQDQLIRALGSRKTSIIIVIPVLGLNAAYLLKHGSGFVLIMTIALIAIVALAVIAGQLVQKGEKQREPQEPGMMDCIQNGLFAFLLIASLYGIFG